MKKLYLLVITFTIFGFNTVAQDSKPDVIVNKSGKQIEAKIIEITDEVVKYKEFSFLDGPTYSISVCDIAVAVFSNSTTKTFHCEKSNPKQMGGIESIIKNNDAEIVQEEVEISIRGSKNGSLKFYANGVQIATWDEMRKYLLHNPKALNGFDGAMDIIKKNRGVQITGVILFFIIPPIGLGLMLGATINQTHAINTIIQTVYYYNGHLGGH